MNLLLTDFMETISLKDPTNAKRYLVFTNDEGEEFRVPVGPEAIQAIMAFAFRDKSNDVSEKEILREAEDDEPEATTFGGDIGEDEDPMAHFELPPSTNVPDSEDKVPSV